MREALFNILAHGIADFAIEGARVLDLFAGTGALGLEALSRGAAYCLFVEEDAEARGADPRATSRRSALTGVTKIFRRDATEPRRGRQPAAPSASSSSIRPTARASASGRSPRRAAGGWLAAGAIAVVEERKGEPIALPSQFAELDRRSWGDTQVLFARYIGTAS